MEIAQGMSKTQVPREQAILRKSTIPTKSPEKRIFPSLAFYNAPSLHTVKTRKEKGRKKQENQNPLKKSYRKIFRWTQIR